MAKRKSRLLAILITGMLYTGFVQAQQSVNTSGGDASGSGGSVAYSIGQISYIHTMGSTGSVAEGVQHAFEIFSTGIRKTESGISLYIFPNPTAGKLTLQISDYENQELTYFLHNMQGKLLNSKQITSKQTNIKMDHLSSATYYIHVVNQENIKVQSFKIIKTQ